MSTLTSINKTIKLTSLLFFDIHVHVAPIYRQKTGDNAGVILNIPVKISQKIVQILVRIHQLLFVCYICMLINLIDQGYLTSTLDMAVCITLTDHPFAVRMSPLLTN